MATPPEPNACSSKAQLGGLPLQTIQVHLAEQQPSTALVDRGPDANDELEAKAAFANYSGNAPLHVMPAERQISAALVHPELDSDDELEAEAAFASYTGNAELDVVPMQTKVDVAYGCDGNLYTQEEFQQYYGAEASHTLWRIAAAVTSDVVLIVEKLTRKQTDLLLSLEQHESFEDAMRAVLAWCHGLLPGFARSAASERTVPRPGHPNAFKLLVYHS